jgi:hypothetical protein
MNLITYNKLHSFNHETKQISVIHHTDLDLTQHAIIKNNVDEVVVASFVDLWKYSLSCVPLEFRNKTLYVHRSRVQDNLAAVLYELTEKLTREHVSLDKILEETVRPPPTPVDIETWIRENIPNIVETPAEIDSYRLKYINQIKSNIITDDWIKVFLKIYYEDNNNLFVRRDNSIGLDSYPLDQ